MELKEKKTEAKEWVSSDGLVKVKLCNELNRYIAMFNEFTGVIPAGFGDTHEEAVNALLHDIPYGIKKLEDFQARLKESLDVTAD